MKRGLKQILTAALTTGLAAAVMAVPFSGAAEVATNPDIQYHAPELEPMVQTLANSLLNDWPHMLQVTDANPGVRYAWTNGGQNVRLGSPTPLQANGLHLVFDGFEPTPGMGANLALTLAISPVNSDYVTDVNGNTMAQLPFVLVIDTTNGSLTAYGSKRFVTGDTEELITTLVESNDALKADALRDKAWEVRLDAANDDTYKVTVNGVEATLPLNKIVGTGSTLDLNACYFVFNVWGGSNSFSINLRSLHGGEAACADKTGEADLAKATAVMNQINSIGTISASSRSAIEQARAGYDALTIQLQTLVTNYETLVLAEHVLPVTEAIASLGTITLDSAGAIGSADELYEALTDEEKLLVSNFSTFADAKTQLLRLQFAAGLTTTAPTEQEPTSPPYEDESQPTDPIDEGLDETDPTETGEPTDATQEPTETEPTAEPTQTTEPSEQPADVPPAGDSSVATILVIVIGVVLLAGMGAAAAVIGIRRKREGGQ